MSSVRRSLGVAGRITYGETHLVVMFRANTLPAVNRGSGSSSGRHAALPDLQTSAGRGADIFPSQCGDGDFAPYLHIARRVVQELYESRVLGIHLAELAAGMVGDNFAGDHPGLFFHEYL